MYTPQFRFALLVCLFVIFGTLGQVLYSYSFGQNGLDLNEYLSGVFMIGSSTFGGFFFIWVCSKFITFNGLKATGFEGVFRDEYGTNFVFKHPIRLTKFLPDLIARPIAGNISDLESDLIAFLSGYKQMPIDINDPKSISLYDYSLGVWRESKKLKNTNSLHHIVALSKHLGLAYVYKPKRKSAPLWQFWVKDKISYSKRCLFHGGLSSFVLSTMPTFHNLDEETKRSLLIAIRFADKPISIPENCDPIAFSLYESLHIAEQRFRKRIKLTPAATKEPSEAAVMQFKKEAKEYLKSSLLDLNLNPQTPINQADGIYLGFGVAVVRVISLLNKISKNLSPDTRSQMDLWEVTCQKHPAWKHLVDLLVSLELLDIKLEDQSVKQDLNTFIVNDTAVRNALLLKLEQKAFPNLRAKLDSLPACTSTVLAEKDKNDLISEIKQKAEKIDQFIKSLYN